MKKVLDKDIIVEKIKNVASYNFNAATIRYLKGSGDYVIRGYAQSMDKVMDIKVTEYQLIAIFYKDEEAIKISDLDDDTIIDLQILMYVFSISPTVLKEAQTIFILIVLIILILILVLVLILIFILIINAIYFFKCGIIISFGTV